MQRMGGDSGGGVAVVTPEGESRKQKVFFQYSHSEDKPLKTPGNYSPNWLFFFLLVDRHNDDVCHLFLLTDSQQAATGGFFYYTAPLLASPHTSLRCRLCQSCWGRSPAVLPGSAAERLAAERLAAEPPLPSGSCQNPQSLIRGSIMR